MSTLKNTYDFVSHKWHIEKE